MWESRVLRRAFERLELHEGKLSRAVLRGGGGGDVTSLPDTWVGNHPGQPGPDYAQKDEPTPDYARHRITRGRHTQPPLPSDSRYKAWPKSANSVSLVPESGLAEAAIHVSSVPERGWPLPRGLTHSDQGDWKTLHWRPAVKRS